MLTPIQLAREVARIQKHKLADTVEAIAAMLKVSEAEVDEAIIRNLKKEIALHKLVSMERGKVQSNPCPETPGLCNAFLVGADEPDVWCKESAPCKMHPKRMTVEGTGVERSRPVLRTHYPFTNIPSTVGPWFD